MYFINELKTNDFGGVGSGRRKKGVVTLWDNSDYRDYKPSPQKVEDRADRNSQQRKNREYQEQKEKEKREYQRLRERQKARYQKLKQDRDNNTYSFKVTPKKVFTVGGWAIPVGVTLKLSKNQIEKRLNQGKNFVTNKYKNLNWKNKNLKLAGIGLGTLSLGYGAYKGYEYLKNRNQ